MSCAKWLGNSAERDSRFGAASRRDQPHAGRCDIATPGGASISGFSVGLSVTDVLGKNTLEVVGGTGIEPVTPAV